MSYLDSLAPVAYPLFDSAVGAVQELDLIATKVMVPIPTGGGRQAGTIIVANTDEFMGGPEAADTAIDSDYPMLEGGVDSTTTYSLGEAKRARFVADRHEAWNQGKGPLSAAAAAQVGRFLALKLELALSSLFFGTGNWTNAAVADLGGGGVQWSTYSTALCDLDLDIMRVRHRETANCEPTDLIMGQQVIDAYRRCLSAQGLRVVTSGAGAAELIPVDMAVDIIQQRHSIRVHVGSARYNSAAPGLAKSGAYVWGKSIWMGNLGDGGAQMTEGGVVLTRRAAALIVDDQGATGLTFGSGQLPINLTATRQEPPKARGTVIAGEVYYQAKKLDGSLGQLYTAAVA